MLTLLNTKGPDINDSPFLRRRRRVLHLVDSREEWNFSLAYHSSVPLPGIYLYSLSKLGSLAVELSLIIARRELFLAFSLVSLGSDRSSRSVPIDLSATLSTTTTHSFALPLRTKGKVPYAPLPHAPSQAATSMTMTMPTRPMLAPQPGSGLVASVAPKPQPQATLTHSDVEWATWYSEIERLYVRERRKLRYVMRYMESKHGFTAT